MHLQPTRLEIGDSVSHTRDLLALSTLNRCSSAWCWNVSPISNWARVPNTLSVQQSLGKRKNRTKTKFDTVIVWRASCTRYSHAHRIKFDRSDSYHSIYSKFVIGVVDFELFFCGFVGRVSVDVFLQRFHNLNVQTTALAGQIIILISFCD